MIISERQLHNLIRYVDIIAHSGTMAYIDEETKERMRNLVYEINNQQSTIL